MTDVSGSGPVSTSRPSGDSRIDGRPSACGGRPSACGGRPSAGGRSSGGALGCSSLRERRQGVREALRHLLEAERGGMELIVPPRPVVAADGERPAKVHVGHVREGAHRRHVLHLDVEAVDQLLGQRDALRQLGEALLAEPGLEPGPREEPPAPEESPSVRNRIVVAVDEDRHRPPEARLAHVRDGVEDGDVREPHALVDHAGHDLRVQARDRGSGMVQEHAELGARHVVPAAGQEDGARDGALPQQLLQPSRQRVQLTAPVRHLLDAVPLVRDRLDVIPVIVLQQAEDVVERVVEPRIALGHQHAGGGRAADRAQPGRVHRRRARRAPHDPRLPGRGDALPQGGRPALQHLLRLPAADLERFARQGINRHGSLLGCLRRRARPSVGPCWSRAAPRGSGYVFPTWRSFTWPQ